MALGQGLNCRRVEGCSRTRRDILADSAFFAEGITSLIFWAERNTQTRDFAWVYQCGGSHKREKIFWQLRDRGYRKHKLLRWAKYLPGLVGLHYFVVGDLCGSAHRRA
jgi:hypothetical protein